MTLQETIRAAVRTTAADLLDRRVVLAGDEVMAAGQLMLDLQWPASTATGPRPTVEQRLEYLRDGVAVLRERASEVAPLAGALTDCGQLLEPALVLRPEDCGQYEDSMSQGPLMDAELALGVVRMLLMTAIDPHAEV